MCLLKINDQLRNFFIIFPKSLTKFYYSNNQAFGMWCKASSIWLFFSMQMQAKMTNPKHEKKSKAKTMFRGCYNNISRWYIEKSIQIGIGSGSKLPYSICLFAEQPRQTALSVQGACFKLLGESFIQANTRNRSKSPHILKRRRISVLPIQNSETSWYSKTNKMKYLIPKTISIEPNIVDLLQTFSFFTWM